VPSTLETCGTDIDEDCDGTVDEQPDGQPCRRGAGCWETGTAVCWVGGCGTVGYNTPCWDGACVDPPGGNCCNYHYSTTTVAPGMVDGGTAPGGYNYCD
jgi:hypothetical protein